MLTNLNSQNIDSEQKEEQSLVEKFLPEDTSIAMLWLVKEPSKLKDDQLPLPDNKRYPYKSKLLNCADREKQHEIKLYYVPIDLTPEQIQKMNDLMVPNKGGKNNIKVIDFNAQFKDKYDLGFLKDQDIPFAWKLDIMRLIMLIEDGPAIYFDALPDKTQLGKIEMNDVGYKMTPHIEWASNDLENSIVAVDSKDNSIISAVYNTMQYLINDSNLREKHKSDHLVWKCHLAAIAFAYNKVHKSQNIELKELEQEVKEWLCNGKEAKCIDYNQRAKYFSYSGPACVMRDFTWMPENQCDLYKEEVQQNCEKKIQTNGVLQPKTTPSGETDKKMNVRMQKEGDSNDNKLEVDNDSAVETPNPTETNNQQNEEIILNLLLLINGVSAPPLPVSNSNRYCFL